VTGIVPTDNSLNIDYDAVIEITFSEPIHPDYHHVIRVENLRNADVNNEGNVLQTTISSSGNSLTITPDEPFEDSAVISVTIPTEITDRAGNHLTTPFTSIFYVLDTMPPEAPLIDPNPPITNQSPLTVIGKTEPGITISGHAFNSNNVSGDFQSVTADSSGIFSISIDPTLPFSDM